MSNTKSISVSSRHLLSSNGSSRGTAYAMSNKIITRGDQIIACWLDKPGMSTVRALNRETEELSPKVEMGQTAMVDNHCGPALVDTSDDHLHIVIGSHNRPFRYRRTVRSGDISEWTGEKPFLPDATYPSVVVSPSDKLHLTSRAYLPRGETCKLVYQHRLPEDDSWSEAIALVKTPAEDGYVSYTNSLTIDSQGTLHLTFQLFHGDPQVSPFVGYLRSPDDGTTWTHSDGTPVELPGTIDTVEIVDEYTDGHVYCHSVVCDLAGHVFILATAAETEWISLYRLNHPGQWKRIDLLPPIRGMFPDYIMGVQGNLSFTDDGTLFVAMDVKKLGGRWADVSTESILLHSSDLGETFSGLNVSQLNSEIPHFLTSVERPINGQPLDHLPSLIYTAGFAGGSNQTEDTTEIHLVTLE